MDQFLGLMSAKADREDVIRLDTRVGHAETRLTELERLRRDQASQRRQRTEQRRWLWPTVAGFLAAIGGILGVLVALHS
jgi:hypothetical protein